MEIALKPDDTMEPNYEFIKDNEFAPAVLVIGGQRIEHTTDEQYIAQGYTRIAAKQPHNARE